MDIVVNWEEIFSLYNTIKWMYALCEEVDPELNTNLQPLNEFRSALDHLMRIIAIENIAEYKDKDICDEVDRLKGHLKRAFFDIADMLSIYYRDKIIDALQDYTSDEISRALPTYYSEIRPAIEDMARGIASLRTEKRFDKGSDENDFWDEYVNKIQLLNDYYIDVIKASPSLLEIHQEHQKEERRGIWTQWIIPIGAIAVGAIIAVAGWFF